MGRNNVKRSMSKENETSSFSDKTQRRVKTKDFEIIDDKIKPELLHGTKIRIKCKNEEQKDFINIIDQNDIILCNGPAGCGKSYISILKSINYLRESGNGYDKIYIITPAVESSSSSVGFLPGDLTSKMSVYMNSIFRLFDKTITEKQRMFMVSNNIIEVLNVSYIRGDNFDNCIVFVDESQNFSKKEMLTILTRIGEKCKMIISGDMMQIDKFNRKEESGLYHSMEKLNNTEDIGIFTFSIDSIVRNGIIKKILDKY